jgi:hypothetical protein
LSKGIEVRGGSDGFSLFDQEKIKKKRKKAWFVSPLPSKVGNSSEFSRPQTTSYLAYCWITDKKFESTVGHRFLSDLSIMPKGSLAQFHYYAERVGPFADPAELPDSTSAKAGARKQPPLSLSCF